MKSQGVISRQYTNKQLIQIKSIQSIQLNIPSIRQPSTSNTNVTNITNQTQPHIISKTKSTTLQPHSICYSTPKPVSINTKSIPTNNQYQNHTNKKNRIFTTKVKLFRDNSQSVFRLSSLSKPNNQSQLKDQKPIQQEQHSNIVFDSFEQESIEQFPNQIKFKNSLLYSTPIKSLQLLKQEFKSNDKESLIKSKTQGIKKDQSLIKQDNKKRQLSKPRKLIFQNTIKEKFNQYQSSICCNLCCQYTVQKTLPNYKSKNIIKIGSRRFLKSKE